MSPKVIFIVLLLSVVRFAVAAEPLYRVKLTSAAEFELVTGPGATDTLTFDSLLQRAEKTTTDQYGRDAIAASCESTAIRIRTKNPSVALQSIFHQIGLQTGLRLRMHLKGMSPAVSEFVTSR